MTGTTTRDAALSRLFGSEARSEDKYYELDDPGGERAVGGGARKDAPEEHGPGVQEEARPRGGTAVSEKSSSKPAVADERDVVGKSGYIGRGRYAREDGILERITPYVRPDQAEALRVAVARKRDPRGKDISRIVQSLLDEAGYQSPAG